MKKKTSSLGEFAKMFFPDTPLLPQPKKFKGADATVAFKAVGDYPVKSKGLPIPIDFFKPPVSFDPGLPGLDHAVDDMYRRELSDSLMQRAEDYFYRAMRMPETRPLHVQTTHEGLLSIGTMEEIIKRVRYKEGSSVRMFTYAGETPVLCVSVRVKERNSDHLTEIMNQTRVEDHHRRSHERFVFFIMERFHSVELHELREQFRYDGQIYDDPHAIAQDSDDTPEGWQHKIKGMDHRLRYEFESKKHGGK